MHRKFTKSADPQLEGFNEVESDIFVPPQSQRSAAFKSHFGLFPPCSEDASMKMVYNDFCTS